jgi:uncharacterized protein YjbI with pentapeptide repeats
MKTPSLLPPKLPKPLPAGASIAALDNGAEYGPGSFTALDLTGQRAAGVVFDQAALQRAIFQSTQLDHPRLSDVRAAGCDFSGAAWAKARFRRVEFNACRLLGVQWVEAQFENVLFRDCNLEGAILVETVFKNARFENCNLRGVSFEAAGLEGVALRRCDLSGAHLAGARLAGADLRGSLLSGASADPGGLKGVVITPEQAVQVAALFGVLVRMEEETLE